VGPVGLGGCFFFDHTVRSCSKNDKKKKMMNDKNDNLDIPEILWLDSLQTKLVKLCLSFLAQIWMLFWVGFGDFNWFRMDVEFCNGIP